MLEHRIKSNHPREQPYQRWQRHRSVHQQSYRSHSKYPIPHKGLCDQQCRNGLWTGFDLYHPAKSGYSNSNHNCSNSYRPNHRDQRRKCYCRWRSTGYRSWGMLEYYIKSNHPREQSYQRWRWHRSVHQQSHRSCCEYPLSCQGVFNKQRGYCLWNRPDVHHFEWGSSISNYNNSYRNLQNDCHRRRECTF